MRARFAFLLLLLPFSAPAEEITYASAPLDIETKGGKLHFTVEVATSEAQHEHGLMFRDKVPDGHGMIFVFPQPRPATFWMKNTLVSLDMLFVDEHGTIIHIAHDAVPQSLAPISSGGTVRAVIEVTGGTAERDHIADGDKVIYSLFQ